MKIKTNELTGAALDWAVAKCDGEVYGPPTFRKHLNGKGATVYKNSGLQQSGIPFRPSTDWAQCGPIIEREKLCVTPDHPNGWNAITNNAELIQFGPTPLIAAMRCYCCDKLGDEIDIPQELQPCQQPNS